MALIIRDFFLLWTISYLADRNKRHTVIWLSAAKLDRCKPGLQRGGRYHLGMKIRYPMECFNRKKTSNLRVSVFLQKGAITQEPAERACVQPRQRAHVAARLAVAVACVLHILSRMKSSRRVHSCKGACSLHPSQGHLRVQSLRAASHPTIDMHISWWCCSAAGGAGGGVAGWCTRYQPQPQLPSYFSFHSPVIWTLREVTGSWRVYSMTQIPVNCSSQVWSSLHLICICHKQAWHILCAVCLELQYFRAPLL